MHRNAPEAKIADEGESRQFPQNLFDPPVKDITPPSKESIRSKIEELIQGMILLKVEDESAWATTLEWMDVTSLGQPLVPRQPFLLVLLNISHVNQIRWVHSRFLARIFVALPILAVYYSDHRIPPIL